MIGTPKNLKKDLVDVLFMNGFEKDLQNEQESFDVYRKGFLEAVVITEENVFGINFAIVKIPRIFFSISPLSSDVRDGDVYLKTIDDRFIENSMDDFWNLWKKSDRIFSIINGFSNGSEPNLVDPDDAQYDLSDWQGGDLPNRFRSKKFMIEDKHIRLQLPNLDLDFTVDDQIICPSFIFKFERGELFYINTGSYASPKTMFEESRALMKQQFVKGIQNADFSQI